MAIEWTSRFETGIPEVDGDHRRLVELINELDAILAENGGFERTGAVIDALIDYADYHFKREEAMLDRVGYAQAADHAAIHASFGHLLGHLVGDCMLTPSHETARRLRDYLRDWLINHILVEDKAFAAALRARDEG